MNGDSSDAPPAPEQNGIAKRDGDERETKEVIEKEDKGNDQMGDLKKQQEGEEDAGGSRPKLAEGFYEIEAVRRKRVRKGQVQYYIKWRGWPETANTWEPYDNLAACYDVIEAFEESLRSGKHRSRKRKRRSTGPVPQVKKKPQGNAACTSTAPDAGNAEFDEGNFVVPSLDDQNHEDGDRSRMGDINSNEAVGHGNENSSVVFPPQVEERENHNEMDANLVELTDAPSPSEGRDRLPVDILELKASEVICLANGDHKVGQDGALETAGLENGRQKVDREGGVEGDDALNGHQKVDEETVKGNSFENAFQVVDREGEMQTGARLGNRKRKPALVKRTSELGCESKADDITEALSITEIMKPISFSSSESAPDILVTFMAKRSDGKEVMVDNKYLKANNPLLLISYYEQHLNYNTATGPLRLGGDSTL